MTNRTVPISSTPIIQFRFTIEYILLKNKKNNKQIEIDTEKRCVRALSFDAPIPLDERRKTKDQSIDYKQ